MRQLYIQVTIVKENRYMSKCGRQHLALAYIELRIRF